MPYRSNSGKYTAKRAGAARTIQAAARKRAFTKARGGLKKVARIQRQPYAPPTSQEHGLHRHPLPSRQPAPEVPARNVPEEDGICRCQFRK